MHKSTVIKILLPIVSISLLITHLIYPDLQIDAITITLFLVAFLPWLPILIKEITLPGGIKITLHELESQSKKIINAAEAQNIETGEDLRKEEEEIDIIEGIVRDNPNLGLVGVRIEIEKRLRELCKKVNIKYNQPISKLLRDLQVKEILSPDIANPLKEIIYLGNKAAHGEPVEENALLWVSNYVPRILTILDTIIKKSLVKANSI